MKKTLLFFVSCVLGVLAVLGGRAFLTPAAVGAPLGGCAELLASNTVLARYVGEQSIPCRFMTALCPDRCDHATRLATFQVVENLDYVKNGEYGDEKLAPGDSAVVDVQKPVPGQPVDIPQRISCLAVGQLVKLTICHYYLKQGQGQFPVRPAVFLEPMEPAARH